MMDGGLGEGGGEAGRGVRILFLRFLFQYI